MNAQEQCLIWLIRSLVQIDRGGGVASHNCLHKLRTNSTAKETHYFTLPNFRGAKKQINAYNTVTDSLELLLHGM